MGASMKTMIIKIIAFVVALLFSLGTPATVYAQVKDTNQINYTITDKGDYTL